MVCLFTCITVFLQKSWHDHAAKFDIETLLITVNGTFMTLIVCLMTNIEGTEENTSSVAHLFKSVITELVHSNEAFYV